MLYVCIYTEVSAPFEGDFSLIFDREFAQSYVSESCSAFGFEQVQMIIWIFRKICADKGCVFYEKLLKTSYLHLILVEETVYSGD